MKIHRSIKIEKTLIDSLDKLAVDQNRSFNNLVETLLMDGVKPKGCHHEYVTTDTHGGSRPGGAVGAICRICGDKPMAQVGYINESFKQDEIKITI